MLGPTEFIEGNESVLVLVFMLKNLADDGRVLFIIDVAVGTNLLGLLLEEAGDLILGQELVSVGINLLEDIGGSGAILDVNQLNLEGQAGLGGDELTSALVTVSEVRGDDEFPLLSHAHVQKTLLPALDHLANANLELERLSPVVAGIELCASCREGAGVVHREHIMRLRNSVAYIRFEKDLLNKIVVCF